MTLCRETNNLRQKYPVLRMGWANVLHEDRLNGVMAFERVHEDHSRMVIIVNAGQGNWQKTDYGAWVGGGNFQEVFNCQAAEYGGCADWKTNKGILKSHEGKLWLNIPGQCTLVFKEVS
jgi:1,4-alpha-glucan branching enzyme